MWMNLHRPVYTECSGNVAMLLAILFWLNCLDFFNKLSESLQKWFATPADQLWCKRDSRLVWTSLNSQVFFYAGSAVVGEHGSHQSDKWNLAWNPKAIETNRELRPTSTLPILSVTQHPSALLNFFYFHDIFSGKIAWIKHSLLTPLRITPPSGKSLIYHWALLAFQGSECSGNICHSSFFS